jgi:hypothetical protein
MTKYSTFLKLDRFLLAASFAASLKPPPLQDGGANYKTWRVCSILWFTAMHCEHVIKGKHTDMIVQSWIHERLHMSLKLRSYVTCHM